MGLNQKVRLCSTFIILSVVVISNVYPKEIICQNYWPFSNQKRNQLHQSLLELGYRNSRTPLKNGKPINVTLDLVIENVETFDDIKQELELTMVLSVNWIDQMLILDANKKQQLNCTSWKKQEECNENSYRTISLAKVASLVWLPNIRIPNLIKSENVGFYADDVPTQLYYRPCDGLMTFERALTITVRCDTSYKWYPYDTQICYFKVLGLANTMPGKELYSTAVDVFKHLVNKKKKIIADIVPLKKPVKEKTLRPKEVTLKWGRVIKTKKSEENGSFKEKVFTVRNLHDQKVSAKVGDLLMVGFEFERTQTAFYVQSFIPSGLLVFASFLSLWIPSHQIPGRMTLAITTTLSLVAMMNREIEKMPKTSYLKCMDIWMIISFSYTFLVLLEFSTVLALTMTVSGVGSTPAIGRKIYDKDSTKIKIEIKKRIANKIERHSRIILPLSYIIFILAFFFVVSNNNSSNMLNAESERETIEELGVE